MNEQSSESPKKKLFQQNSTKGNQKARDDTRAMTHLILAVPTFQFNKKKLYLPQEKQKEFFYMHII